MGDLAAATHAIQAGWNFVKGNWIAVLLALVAVAAVAFKYRSPIWRTLKALAVIEKTAASLDALEARVAKLEVTTAPRAEDIRATLHGGWVGTIAGEKAHLCPKCMLDGKHTPLGEPQNYAYGDQPRWKRHCSACDTTHVSDGPGEPRAR